MLIHFALQNFGFIPIYILFFDFAYFQNYFKNILCQVLIENNIYKLVNNSVNHVAACDLFLEVYYFTKTQKFTTCLQQVFRDFSTQDFSTQLLIIINTS